MTVAVVLFTSDLRVHDHPPLRAALRAADEVVPLFVRDPAIHAAGFDAPNRSAFLADCLTDLDAALRRRGGRLVVRSGPVDREVAAVVAECGRRRCTWPRGSRRTRSGARNCCARRSAWSAPPCTCTTAWSRRSPRGR